MAGAVRQPQGAGVPAGPGLLDAVDGAHGQEGDQVGAGVGTAHREPQLDATVGGAGRAARPRRDVGVAAYTSRTVSLNCRMLEKPAAKATSANGIGVVSTRIRAVCARRARASASGPAPTSW